ncbi:MAG: SGNH/GDSL hydrolase family protein [Patescibacteria group bacterium]
MRLRLVRLVVLLEILIILFLGLRVYQNKSKVSIVPIKKDKVVFPAENSLKDFYESKPNVIGVIERWEIPWLDQEHITTTTNSEGFNERFEYSLAKPRGAFRVVALGDSFTWGVFVDTPKNYPERIEDLLNRRVPCGKINKFEVINLGEPGYDIAFAKHRFDRRGAKYRPDMVLWFIRGDHFLVSASDEPFKIAFINEQLLKRTAVLGLKNLGGVGDVLGSYSLAQGEVVTRHEYSQLTELIKSFKGKVVLITEAKTPQRIKKLLRLATLTRDGVFLFDNLPDFERFPDGHPSTRGYEQIADKITSFLISNRVIQCE